MKISQKSEKDEILEFNRYMKFDKMLYIIYADMESWFRIIGGGPNNSEKSSTTTIGEHIPCGISRKRSMKKLCESWTAIVRKVC